MTRQILADALASQSKQINPNRFADKVSGMGKIVAVDVIRNDAFKAGKLSIVAAASPRKGDLLPTAQINT